MATFTSNSFELVVNTTLLFTGNPVFVDATLGGNITDGTYNHLTRDGTGIDGYNAYTTIQGAVDWMTTAGDEVYVRGGTYLESVLINGSTSPSGTSWADGEHCALQSYPGEWAVIDAQGLTSYCVGKPPNGNDEGNGISYWRFERLEITGGGRAADTVGGGLYISDGPFKCRFLSVHDNLSGSASNNPAGINGYGWNDSVIEFCFVKDNGATGSSNGNSANINIYSDYNWQAIAAGGYQSYNSRIPAINNTIRYNHIAGSGTGYRVKGSQLFTGRFPGVSDFIDDFSDNGDKIHHNYFVNQGAEACVLKQDFANAYNNIFDGTSGWSCMAGDTQPDKNFYKQVIYNNTCVDFTGAAIVRYGALYWPFAENQNHYGWDYNNIVDGASKRSAGWFTGVGINVFCGATGSRTPYDSPDITNYVNSNNYFYRPGNADIFAFHTPTQFFTQAEFEAQALTGGTKIVYQNNLDAGNLLYTGTTGADKYITEGTHLIEAGVTVADGGVGGAHPYLAGVTIPSYVGAVNPNDSAWVDGVLTDVASIAWLTAQELGSTPTWVES